MMSPNSQDDLPYARIAFYATRALRVWLWPNHLSRRVVLAAMSADSPREAAVAAVEEACRLLALNTSERR